MTGQRVRLLTANSGFRANVLPGFLKVQYTMIAKIAVVIAVIIFLSYKMRPYHANATGVESLGSTVLGLIGSVSFLLVGGHGE